MTAFIDEALIRVKAGDGGNGAVAFRREKYVPLGGPSGGDGGSGGSVVLEVDEGLGTLLDFRYRTEYRAPSGENGGNKDMYGRGGEDLVLRVPPGTQVFADDREGNRQQIGDLRTHGERLVVARGGRGGRGNIHFKTSTERAPRRAYPGSPGQEREIRLELKLLADVGLLGFPNVGKSSFIARISAARPKIADYPFTTLVPNLGVVGLSGERSFVVADVPGLIKGAHAGAGLGLRFLRHLERTRVLLHLIEISPDPSRSPLEDYEALREELELFDPGLAGRPEIVVLNKVDLPDTQKRVARLREAFARRKVPFHVISAVTGEGVPALLEAVWRFIAHDRQQEKAARASESGAAAEPQRERPPHLPPPPEDAAPPAEAPVRAAIKLPPPLRSIKSDAKKPAAAGPKAKPVKATKPASKPASKPATTAAKTVKARVKPGAKRIAKPATKPRTKSKLKLKTKPATKPATKSAAKKAAKPATKSKAKRAAKPVRRSSSKA